MFFELHFFKKKKENLKPLNLGGYPHMQGPSPPPYITNQERASARSHTVTMQKPPQYTQRAGGCMPIMEMNGKCTAGGRYALQGRRELFRGQTTGICEPLSWMGRISADEVPKKKIGKVVGEPSPEGRISVETISQRTGIAVRTFPKKNLTRHIVMHLCICAGAS